MKRDIDLKASGKAEKPDMGLFASLLSRLSGRFLEWVGGQTRHSGTYTKKGRAPNKSYAAMKKRKRKLARASKQVNWRKAKGLKTVRTYS